MSDEDEIDKGNLPANTNESSSPQIPRKRGKGGKYSRAGLSAVGGAIPFAGGLLSAAAGYWSDSEQEEVNDFLLHWVNMLKEELAEKEKTILEVMARLDMQNEQIKARISSDEFQGLVKTTFRDWSAGQSEAKRNYVRNILANAASSSVSSDDVVRMFIDWLGNYSEMHFEVIGSIYNSDGITRGQIWQKIGRGNVREDSAEADLFKLLIRDLSTGGVIRQHRETDYQGNFLKKSTRGTRKSNSGGIAKSAFSDDEGYELTALGQSFVHYAMNELSIRISHDNFDNPE